MGQKFTFKREHDKFADAGKTMLKRKIGLVGHITRELSRYT